MFDSLELGDELEMILLNFLAFLFVEKPDLLVEALDGCGDYSLGGREFPQGGFNLRLQLHYWRQSQLL